MSQLSVYIDEKTQEKLERAAKARDISISKYIREALHKSFAEEWPADFFSLCGSLTDETFERPEQGSLSTDVPREVM